MTLPYPSRRSRVAMMRMTFADVNPSDGVGFTSIVRYRTILGAYGAGENDGTAPREARRSARLP